MNYEPFPDFTNTQPAPVFNGLNFSGMGQWGQLPVSAGQDLAAPLTSRYSFNAIDPTPGGGFNSINTNGVQLSQLPMGATSPTAQLADPSIWSNFLQQRRTDGSTTGGYGTAALGLAQGLGSLYLGMQQYQIAKDTLAANKANADRNFAAQRTTVNSQLEDRQRARVAANPGAYQSVSDYMDQNRVR